MPLTIYSSLRGSGRRMIASISRNTKRPPSSAGNGNMLTMPRLTEISAMMNTMLSTASPKPVSSPTAAASLTALVMPTGPDISDRWNRPCTSISKDFHTLLARLTVPVKVSSMTVKKFLSLGSR